MKPIILEECLDDECIDTLKAIEKEMYLAGDSRSQVLRQVLDLLWLHDVIEDNYKQPQLKLEYDEDVSKTYIVVSVATGIQAITRSWKKFDTAKKYADKMGCKYVAKEITI